MSRDYGSTGAKERGPSVGGFAVEAELGPSVLGRAYRTTEAGRPARVLVLDREDYAWLLRTRYTESRVNLDLAGVRPLRDAVIAPDASFLVADVAPATLAERIAKSGSRPGPQAILEIVRKGARIVAAAHALGRVHGLLSLQDIEIDEGDVVSVGGFGLAEVARRLAEGLYEAHVARTPQDVAPEVRGARKGAGSSGRGAATARTDVYALGQILKRALGVPLAPSILPVIEKATAESPEARYADAGAFLAALEPIVLADSSSEEPAARGSWKTTLMPAATLDEDEPSEERAPKATAHFGGKLFVEDAPARPAKPATPKTGKKNVTEAATLGSLDELEADAPAASAPRSAPPPPPPPPAFAPPPPPPPPPPPVVVPPRATASKPKPPAPDVADVLKHLEAIDAQIGDKEPGSITGQLKVPSVLSDAEIDSGDILGDFHSLEDARAKRKRPDPKSRSKGKGKRKKPDDDLSALGNLDDLPVLDDLGAGAASGDGYTALGSEQALPLGFDAGAVNPSFDDPNSSGNYSADPFRDPLAPPPPPPPRQAEPGTRPGKRTASSKTKATGWASDDTLKGLAGDAPPAPGGGFDDPFGAPPPPAPAGFDPFADPFASAGSQGFGAPAGDPFAGPPPGGGFGGDPFAPAAADPFAGPGGFAPPPNQGFAGGDPFAGQQGGGGGFGGGGDPFAGQPGQQGAGFGGDPFAGQPGGGFGGGDPFAPPQGGGFGGGGDPFGAPQGGGFGAPQGGGFGGGDPFGAPQGGGFGAPQGGGFGGGGDPFGAPQGGGFGAPQGGGFGAPQGGDFGAPQGGGFGGGDPFGAPQGGGFGAPQGGGFGGGDPFGAPQGGGFGAPQGSDPFGAPPGGGFGAPQGSDPFGAPPGGGFGSPQGSDPFGAPQGGGFGGPGGDPFGAPQGGGFGGPGGDPFGAPQGGGFGGPGGDPFGSSPPGGGFGGPAPAGFDPFQEPGAGDPFAPPPGGAPASFGVTQADPLGAPGGFGASPGFDDPFAAPSAPPRTPAFDPYAVTLGPTPQLTPGGDPFGTEGGAAGFDPFGSNAAGPPGPGYDATPDLAAMSAPTMPPQRFLPPASGERQAFMGSNDASPFDVPDAELDLGAPPPPPQRAPRGAFSLLIGGFQGPKKDKAAQVLAKLRTCSKNEAIEALAANVVTVLEGVTRAQAEQVGKLFQAIEVQVKITEKKG
jgi:hypothetical protein